MEDQGPIKSSIGLEKHGIKNAKSVFWNLAEPALYEESIRRSEGLIAPGGSLVVETGEYTGRSPKDKFIVEEPSSRDDIWWGAVNKSISEDNYNAIRAKIVDYYKDHDLFIQDAYAGADLDYQLNIRLVTETAWHALFARNMFIQPNTEALANFDPSFTILHAPGLNVDPATDGTNSDICIILNFGAKEVLITGTWYAGEIKKSVFSILNYLLPAEGVMPMHCSANVGSDNDAAIFFGLSGTGKTTLSADGSRTLVGDDEHGWSDNGIFNFEGGCYAKAINLSAEAEPEIYATTHRFGTVLENVVIDPVTRELDFSSDALTENTRVSYPIEFIPNISETLTSGRPEHIVMLTADAFGVLPPISKMSADQAMYHFLSGYTARVAGTERGVTEPEATFSTCFGAPFMSRHPTVYAKLLGDLIARHKTQCWLVNTGWTGGAYGVGTRMKIAHTRAMLTAALEGKLDSVVMAPDPNFGMDVPQSCPDVPDEVLNPRNTWSDKAAYDKTAQALAGMFEKNFVEFEPQVDDGIKKAAIRPAA
ncbi:MAG: phosphoenolpyruvate carboxykinase [Rhodospirillales bacterium]|nr:phosphoenolpyruvate carboxykinase [Rhodospirillales bacterium]MBT4005865.1 phosphoenolpyruvate carboxykinase [Rhodospirillales bacterium]MBT5076428.1 phosphoenolpyruvate carboxykinase [Rhodospirillales bacterium]MBT5114150.1 phosphoenolpyruvate carboxykinase [Rhodospirillales bacterium]MBT5672678.1 phosphoenolpyruvate carboxykinase [Rhodospirillales bacterium]